MQTEKSHLQLHDNNIYVQEFIKYNKINITLKTKCSVANIKFGIAYQKDYEYDKYGQSRPPFNTTKILLKRDIFL